MTVKTNNENKRLIMKMIITLQIDSDGDENKKVSLSSYLIII